MRLTNWITLVAATVGSEPIDAEAKIVLRCEDTTSTGDGEALSLCQWGCYRQCVAQPDGELSSSGDVVISGEALASCRGQLPNNCRLHGSLFHFATLNTYCAERATSGLMYKILVPQASSDLGLYTTSFTPTSVSLGLSGRVPTDVCLKSSGFDVNAYGGASLDYKNCSTLTTLETESATQKLAQNTTFPFFSINRLDIPLDVLATTLANLQTAFQDVENHLVVRTDTNCFVQKPDQIYLFYKGNFTLTTSGTIRAMTTTLLLLIPLSLLAIR